jgi:hypothetical protein
MRRDFDRGVGPTGRGTADQKRQAEILLAPSPARREPFRPAMA